MLIVHNVESGDRGMYKYVAKTMQGHDLSAKTTLLVEGSHTAVEVCGISACMAECSNETRSFSKCRASNNNGLLKYSKLKHADFL